MRYAADFAPLFIIVDRNNAGFGSMEDLQGINK